MHTGRTETAGLVQFADIQPTQVHFRSVNVQPSTEFWTVNHERFIRQITAKIVGNVELTVGASVDIVINVLSENVQLRVDTDETYSVRIVRGSNQNLVATIEAETIFGARHGLESLAQMVVYDDVQRRLLMRFGIEFTDGPVYGHRGVSLDTSRNYFHTDTIKRMIGLLFDGVGLWSVNL